MVAEICIAVSNSIRLTFASFLAYFIMSAMLAPIGIVLPPLAEHIGRPVDEVAPLFSWLTMGILVGSALALIVFDVLSIRSWMLIIYTLTAGCLLTLWLTDELLLIQLSLGLVGTGCGIGLSAAASTIAQVYSDDHRASMMVITDASFSVAGVVTSALAVTLVAMKLHWSATYLGVAAVALLLLVLVVTSTFPKFHKTVGPVDGAVLRWPIPVWLCIAALFLFTLGQSALLWWLPTHLETALDVPREQAGVVVSRFWTGMLMAQILAAWWVFRIGARRLVLLSVCGAFLGSVPLWLVTEISLLPWFSLLWGLGNLGLLKVVLTFATLTVERPSPRLVSALLFGATLGTAISPVTTSEIAGLLDARAVLQFGSICYAVLAVLVFLAWWYDRAAQNDLKMIREREASTT